MGRAKFAIALFLPALSWSADLGRCQLTKNLYEDRQAVMQKQPAAESSAAGKLLPPGTSTATEKLSEIDKEYRGFIAELETATQAKDDATINACCERAGIDRAGALVCGLALYLNNGRKDSSSFLDQFPSSRKETAMLWELNTLSGTAGTSLFPPSGPSYKLIDELFLLVMDERDVAITKYFNLATHTTSEGAGYMDRQIRVFLREAPAVVVHQWLILRRYRPKLKAAAQSLLGTSTPAQVQALAKAVRSFCDKSNPDCPDIFKLYSGK